MIGAPAWAGVLLLWAVCVLIPWAAPWERFGSAGRWPAAARLSGLLLACSFMLEPGLAASLLAAPWLAFTVALGICGLAAAVRPARALAERTADLSCALLTVGGAWTFAARLGYQPLGFDPMIVLLTGVHFHYAGFALCWCAAAALRALAAAGRGVRIARAACAGALLAVPAVAVGITCTQLGAPAFVETAAALLMALAGACVALAQAQSVLLREVKPAARALGLLSSGALLAGMILAAAYGMRFAAPATAPPLEFMVFTHGSLNALGFATCGILAAARGVSDRV
jgi:hypothetical protein